MEKVVGHLFRTPPESLLAPIPGPTTTNDGPPPTSYTITATNDSAKTDNDTTQDIFIELSTEGVRNRSGHSSSDSSDSVREFKKAVAALYPGRFDSFALLALVIVIVLSLLPPILVIFRSRSSVSIGKLLLSTSGTFAFLPAVVILYLLFFYKNKDKATYTGIAKFFLFGLVSILPVLLVETLETLPFIKFITQMKTDSANSNIAEVIGSSFYFAFIVAALTEETAKYLSTFLLSKHSPIITNRYTVVLLVASSALGFATFENYGYVVSEASSGNVVETVLSVISRALLSVPLHTVTGIFIGYKVALGYFSVEKKNTGGFKFYVQCIWQPVLFHALFDFFAFGANQQGWWYFCLIVPVGLTVAGIVMSYRKIQEIHQLDQEGQSLDMF